MAGLFQFQRSYHPGNISNITHRQRLKWSRQTIRIRQPKHACGCSNNPETFSMFWLSVRRLRAERLSEKWFWPVAD